MFTIFPCTESGKMLKGFCPCECDAVGCANTVLGWILHKDMFGIKYYALRRGSFSSDMSYYEIVKL